MGAATQSCGVNLFTEICLAFAYRVFCHRIDIKAGELVSFVAQQVGDKGAGKPDMAMAGGTDAGQLPAALKSVKAWVAERA